MEHKTRFFNPRLSSTVTKLNQQKFTVMTLFVFLRHDIALLYKNSKGDWHE